MRMNHRVTGTISVGALGLAAAFACAVTMFAQGVAPAGQAPSAQQLFEAAQYDQALKTIAARRTANPAAAMNPVEAYLAGHVYLRMNRNVNAKQEFARLAASDAPVWRLVGESSVLLIDGNLDLALQKVTQATTLLAAGPAMTSPTDGSPPVVANAPEKFHASYQTGLVKARREDWQGAGAAFARAAQLDPAFGYAHYYAGMAYSRVRRPDLVALHFQHFLKIAPKAPERPAVMSILRTIRGI